MPECNYDCDRFEKLNGLTWGEFKYIDDDDLEQAANGGSGLSYGDLHHSKDPDNKWFEVDYCTGSDYSGDLLHKSNYRVLLEECGKALKDPDTCQEPWFVELSGGHGTFSIALHCERTPEEIFEMIEKLDNYPILDEDDYSSLQIDEEGEAWDNWAKSDFEHELRKTYESYNFDDITDDELWELFRKGMEEANEYWEVEGMGVHIRIDRIVENISPDDFPKSVKTEGYEMDDDLDGLSRSSTSGTMSLPAWVRTPRSTKRTTR